jgi:hypothetical protein
MATNNDNEFTSPWNDSDMVLVVEDQELHVHKWMLKLHSPVFKAMFDGDFKEAGQDKITLEGKEYESMVQFLKILYPSSMFGEVRAPLNDESLLSILALAEEYQCVKLIKLCIDEARITAGNVLHILPYVLKYHQTVLPKLYAVMNWGASTSKLEKVLPEIKVKETSDTMLLTKCRFLESAVVKMQDAIFSLISDFIRQKKVTDDTQTSLSATKERLNYAKKKIESLERPTKQGYVRYKPYYVPPPDTSQVTTGDPRCTHSIGIREISKTKSCPRCKEKYKEKFLAPIYSCKDTQNFFDMLRSGDDVAQHCR